MKPSNSYQAKGELITCKSSTGFDLDGIMYLHPQAATTVVHIHGSFGNFYQNAFIRVMAQMYHEAGINFLSINTSCHDGVAEGYRSNSEFAYVGGGLSRFDECVSDIEGAVSFAAQFSDRIILQGHSLGCDRVLHFIISKQTKYDFVLLSPCDSYQLQTNWISPETVEQQIARLKVQKPSDPVFDWLPSREYGVKGSGDWTYAIPITRLALLSIMEGPPYSLFRMSKPPTFTLSQRSLVYIGGRDALQVWPQDVMFKYFKERIKDVTEVFIESGDHMMAKFEKTVAARVITWLGS